MEASDWCKHPDSRYVSWAVVLKCNNCSPTISWSVCTTCSGKCKILQTTDQIYQHHYHQHRVPEKHQESSEDPDELHSMDVGGGENFSEEEEGFQSDSRVLLDFTSDENKAYFHHEFQGDKLGITYLAARSAFKQKQPPMENINEEDVKLQLLLAEMCYNLSHGEREKLANIVDLIVKQTKCNQEFEAENENNEAAMSKSNGDGCGEWVPRMTAATTPAEMRSQFIDGKHAVVPNLPHPKVQQVGQHAYISVIECIQDLLGHGIQLDVIAPPLKQDKITCLGESRKALEILANAEEVLGADAKAIWITEWSDDFEPNTSTKSNRGSVWIKTATISMPHKTEEPILYTYPIAFGPKKASHKEVEEMIRKDLGTLQSKKSPWFYCSLSKKKVRVYAQLLASIQDQPERCGANFMMLGSSLYAARFGYMFNGQENAASLPSCQSCHNMLLQKGQRDSNCQVCKTWNMEEGTLLTYSILENAVKTTHKMLVTQNWTEMQAKNFLSAHCINTDAQESILEHAANVVGFNYLVEQGMQNSYSSLLDDHSSNTHMYKQWVVPVLWRCPCMSLWQHIKATMHLFFLGLQKTLMIDSQTWLSLQLKLETF